eukprot:GHVL01020912.1.p1 GENE.GHVL01020912.1~~GHVL01020912.1.p1  ORF type:complete len:2424 (+),score=681.04 GHVL01020912.1:740-7273(+)
MNSICSKCPLIKDKKWILKDNMCSIIIDEPKNDRDAQRVCKSLGGHLPVIETDADDARMSELVTSSGGSLSVGIEYDTSSSSWKRQNGESIEKLSYWKCTGCHACDGERDCQGKCLHHNGFEWQMKDCLNKSNFACQTKATDETTCQEGWDTINCKCYWTKTEASATLGEARTKCESVEDSLVVVTFDPIALQQIAYKLDAEEFYIGLGYSPQANIWMTTAGDPIESEDLQAVCPTCPESSPNLLCVLGTRDGTIRPITSCSTPYPYACGLTQGDQSVDCTFEKGLCGYRIEQGSTDWENVFEEKLEDFSVRIFNPLNQIFIFIQDGFSVLRSPRTFPDKKCLSFDFLISSVQLSVAISENNETWQQSDIIWTVEGDQSLQWHTAHINIDKNTFFKILFRAQGNINDIIALDNIYTSTKSCSDIANNISCDFDKGLYDCSWKNQSNWKILENNQPIKEKNKFLENSIESPKQFTQICSKFDSGITCPEGYYISQIDYMSFSDEEDGCENRKSDLCRGVQLERLLTEACKGLRQCYSRALESTCGTKKNTFVSAICSIKDDYCPFGWDYISENCYKHIFSYPKTYISSKNICETMGGMLAIPINSIQDDYMKQRHAPDLGRWRGSWKGSPSDECFSYEIDNTSSDKSLAWVESNCDEEKSFTCEKPSYKGVLIDERFNNSTWESLKRNYKFFEKNMNKYIIDSTLYNIIYNGIYLTLNNKPYDRNISIYKTNILDDSKIYFSYINIYNIYNLWAIFDIEVMWSRYRANDIKRTAEITDTRYRVVDEYDNIIVNWTNIKYENNNILIINNDNINDNIYYNDIDMDNNNLSIRNIIITFPNLKYLKSGSSLEIEWDFTGGSPTNFEMLVGIDNFQLHSSDRNDYEYPCPSREWRVWENNCYMSFESSSNWWEADRECSIFKGALISAQYLSELLYIINDDQTTWIGLNDQETENFFGWSDSSKRVSYDILSKITNNTEDNDCVKISNGELIAEKCSAKIGRRICRVKAKNFELNNTKDICDDDKDYFCPEGFRLSINMDTCYSIYSDKNTWNNAQNICINNNSNLLTISNIDEYISIYDWYKLYNNDEFWIGLYIKDNNYIYINNEDGIKYKDEKIKNNDTYCGILSKDICIEGICKDIYKSCDELRPFICEAPVTCVDSTISECVNPSYECPYGWNFSKETKKCYLMTMEPKTKEESEKTCASFSSELLSFSSQKEYIYILNYIYKSIYTSYEYWTNKDECITYIVSPDSCFPDCQECIDYPYNCYGDFHTSNCISKHPFFCVKEPIIHCNIDYKLLLDSSINDIIKSSTIWMSLNELYCIIFYYQSRNNSILSIKIEYNNNIQELWYNKGEFIEWTMGFFNIIGKDEMSTLIFSGEGDLSIDRVHSQKGQCPALDSSGIGEERSLECDFEHDCGWEFNTSDWYIAAEDNERGMVAVVNSEATNTILKTPKIYSNLYDSYYCIYFNYLMYNIMPNVILKIYTKTDDYTHIHWINRGSQGSNWENGFFSFSSSRHIINIYFEVIFVDSDKIEYVKIDNIYLYNGICKSDIYLNKGIYNMNIYNEGTLNCTFKDGFCGYYQDMNDDSYFIYENEYIITYSIIKPVYISLYSPRIYYNNIGCLSFLFRQLKNSVLSIYIIEYPMKNSILLWSIIGYHNTIDEWIKGIITLNKIKNEVELIQIKITAESIDEISTAIKDIQVTWGDVCYGDDSMVITTSITGTTSWNSHFDTSYLNNGYRSHIQTDIHYFPLPFILYEEEKHVLWLYISKIGEDATGMIILEDFEYPTPMGDYGEGATVVSSLKNDEIIIEYGHNCLYMPISSIIKYDFNLIKGKYNISFYIYYNSILEIIIKNNIKNILFEEIIGTEENIWMKYIYEFDIENNEKIDILFESKGETLLDRIVLKKSSNYISLKPLNGEGGVGLISSPGKLLESQNYCLSFYFKINAIYLYIYLYINNDEKYEIWSINGHHGNIWHKGKISIIGNNKINYLLFKGKINKNDEISLDDINLESGKCPGDDDMVTVEPFSENIEGSPTCRFEGSYLDCGWRRYNYLANIDVMDWESNIDIPYNNILDKYGLWVINPPPNTRAILTSTKIILPTTSISKTSDNHILYNPENISDICVHFDWLLYSPYNTNNGSLRIYNTLNPYSPPGLSSANWYIYGSCGLSWHHGWFHIKQHIYK